MLAQEQLIGRKGEMAKWVNGEKKNSLPFRLFAFSPLPPFGTLSPQCMPQKK
jgi:hypothetical protein